MRTPCLVAAVFCACLWGAIGDRLHGDFNDYDAAGDQLHEDSYDYLGCHDLHAYLRAAPDDSSQANSVSKCLGVCAERRKPIVALWQPYRYSHKKSFTCLCYDSLVEGAKRLREDECDAPCDDAFSCPGTDGISVYRIGLAASDHDVKTKSLDSFTNNLGLLRRFTDKLVKKKDDLANLEKNITVLRDNMTANDDSINEIFRNLPNGSEADWLRRTADIDIPNLDQLSLHQKELHRRLDAQLMAKTKMQRDIEFTEDYIEGLRKSLRQALANITKNDDV